MTVVPWRQLEQRERLGQVLGGWRSVIPAASVLMAALSARIPVVTPGPIWPDLALALLLAWRLYRPAFTPPWVGLPLGLAVDLIYGQPLGLAAMLWPMLMLLIDEIERRLVWRSYWHDWAFAAIALAVAGFVSWRIATGDAIDRRWVAPPYVAIVATVLCFPAAARLAAWIERRLMVAG